MRAVSQNLRQQLCVLLFLEGREMLHGGQLWTGSRAAPSGMRRLQATAAFASALPFCRGVFQTSAEPRRQHLPWTPAWSFCPSQATQTGLWVAGDREVEIRAAASGPVCALSPSAGRGRGGGGEGEGKGRGRGKGNCLRILLWKSLGQLNLNPSTSC